MTGPRRVLLAFLLLVPFMASAGAQDAPPAAAPVVLSTEEMETFLKTAKIVRKRDAGKGVTDTVRATFSDGRVTHDAQIQTVNIQQMRFEAGKATELNFKDTYRFNIGGYRLARLLGMDNMPMSVERRVDSKDAAITWWIDDVQFDESGRLKQKSILGPNPERTTKQIHVMRVFDELIQNRDRNQGNMLWTKDWSLWLIDHTRAFRLGKELLKPDQLTRCERSLFEAMKKLTLEDLQASMRGIMQKDELEAVIARRNVIVKHFEDRIASRGEAAVLFNK
jgi:hypothetical protein